MNLGLKDRKEYLPTYLPTFYLEGGHLPILFLILIIVNSIVIIIVLILVSS